MYQAENRSRSWRRTIADQRQKLEGPLDSGVLRNHAAVVLPRAYAHGVKVAVADMGLPVETFPAECPYSLAQALN